MNSGAPIFIYIQNILYKLFVMASPTFLRLGGFYFTWLFTIVVFCLKVFLSYEYI